MDDAIISGAEALKTFVLQSFRLSGQIINGAASFALHWTVEPGYLRARRARLTEAPRAETVVGALTAADVSRLIDQFAHTRVSDAQPAHPPQTVVSRQLCQRAMEEFSVPTATANRLEATGEFIAHQVQPTPGNRWSPGIVDEARMAILVYIDAVAAEWVHARCRRRSAAEKAAGAPRSCCSRLSCGCKWQAPGYEAAGGASDLLAAATSGYTGAPASSSNKLPNKHGDPRPSASAAPAAAAAPAEPHAPRRGLLTWLPSLRVALPSDSLRPPAGLHSGRARPGQHGGRRRSSLGSAAGASPRLSPSRSTSEATATGGAGGVGSPLYRAATVHGSSRLHALPGTDVRGAPASPLLLPSAHLSAPASTSTSSAAGAPPEPLALHAPLLPAASSSYCPFPRISAVSTACQIIDAVCGFPVETYAAVTVDGYVLTLVRIPRPEARRVVFFMHGLLDSATAWVSTGNVYSLAARAYQAGCDVFLGNLRGSNDAMGTNGLGANPADYGEEIEETAGRAGATDDGEHGAGGGGEASLAHAAAEVGKLATASMAGALAAATQAARTLPGALSSRVASLTSLSTLPAVLRPRGTSVDSVGGGVTAGCATPGADGVAANGAAAANASPSAPAPATSPQVVPGAFGLSSSASRISLNGDGVANSADGDTNGSGVRQRMVSPLRGTLARSRTYSFEGADVAALPPGVLPTVASAAAATAAAHGGLRPSAGEPAQGTVSHAARDGASSASPSSALRSGYSAPSSAAAAASDHADTGAANFQRRLGSVIGTSAEGIPVHLSLHPRQPEYWRFGVDDHALDVMAFMRQIRIIKALEAPLRAQLRGEGSAGAASGGATAAAGKETGKDGRRAKKGGSASGAHTDSSGSAGAGRDARGAPVDATSTAADDCTVVGVGHSMGGCVLMLHVLLSRALRRPHWLDKMILLSPAGLHKWVPFVSKMLLFVLYGAGALRAERPFPMRSSTLQRFAARALQDLKRLQVRAVQGAHAPAKVADCTAACSGRCTQPGLTNGRVRKHAGGSSSPCCSALPLLIVAPGRRCPCTLPSLQMTPADHLLPSVLCPSAFFARPLCRARGTSWPCWARSSSAASAPSSFSGTSPSPSTPWAARRTRSCGTASRTCASRSSSRTTTGARPTGSATGRINHPTTGRISACWMCRCTLWLVRTDGVRDLSGGCA